MGSVMRSGWWTCRRSPGRRWWRLVGLTGAGGCGKTRLGVQVVGVMVGWFGDGVWLVELAAVCEEAAVAAAICQAVGISGQRGRSSLEALLDALASQDVLIVL